MASMSLISFTQNGVIGLTLLPGVLAGIRAVEDHAAAVHAAGGPVLSGADKKALVTSSIFAGVQIAAQAGEQIPNVYVATVSTLIDGFVSIFNASGVFSHKPTASTQAATS